jgi:hypothetical protein
MIFNNFFDEPQERDFKIGEHVALKSGERFCNNVNIAKVIGYSMTNYNGRFVEAVALANVPDFIPCEIVHKVSIFDISILQECHNNQLSVAYA